MSTVAPEGTVAILGPFGFGNLGDAAIQDAVLAHLRRRLPAAKVVGISMNPADTQHRHGIEAFAYHTLAFRALHEPSGTPRSEPAVIGRGLVARIQAGLQWRLERWRARVAEARHILYVLRVARQLDVLLISGGGQLDDFWGGPRQHPYTLFKWSCAARLCGVKLMFLSVGVGSVFDARSRRLLRWSLGLAAYRSYRDEGSLLLVRERIGFAGPDRVVPDMAFGLPVADPPACVDRPPGGRRVAIGPIPYCRPDIWPERDQRRHDDYVDRLSCFCAALLRRGDEVSFVVGEVDHDPVVIEAVVRRLEAAEPARMTQVRVPRIATVAELLAELRRADIVVSSRFHGVLLSLLLRRPVLALSYERKVRQLMADVGLSQCVLDIEQSTVDQMTAMFDEMQASRDELEARMAESVPAQTRQVLAQFDAVFQPEARRSRQSTIEELR